MGVSQLKRIIALTSDLIGLGWLGLKVQTFLYGPHIRAIGYHSVLAENAEMFERHVEWYSRHFDNIGPTELAEFLSGGTRITKRPGILLTFDDGTRTHFETAAPILEKYGFTGWFFVPSGLLNLEENDPSDEFSRDGTRQRNLTLGQLKYLAGRHVVGSHGVTHIRLSENVPSEALEYEITDSRSQLESYLGQPVTTFSWIGGEVWAYCTTASELVRKTYCCAFMGNSDVILPHTDPFQLGRSNVEAYFPMSLVRFQLSGIVDLYFTPRRRRVLQTTRRLHESSPSTSR